MKTSSPFLAVMVSVGLFALSGCATPAGLFPARFPVATSPGGSEMAIDGRNDGVTPFETWLSASRPHLFVARKDGWGRTAALLLPADDNNPPRIFVWSADSPLSEVLNYQPGSVNLWLRAPGDADTFSTLLRDVTLVDEMMASGRLSKRQHRALTGALMDFFVPPDEETGRD
jgi:hypothetical protein